MKPPARSQVKTFCAALLLSASLTGLQAQPANPGWWIESETAIIVPGAPPNNYGPANIGQLKHVATQAAEHFDENLPGGAGTEITSIVNGFTSQGESDFAPINLGQLKHIAKPFYDRMISFEIDTKAHLIARGYPSNWSFAYPWDPTPGSPNAKNFAPATIGQLKMVFSFDVEDFFPAPAGWSDWINTHFPGQPSTNPYADADNDGLTNLEEFNAGTNPNSTDSDYDGNPDATDPDPTDPDSFTAMRLGYWSLDDTAFESDQGFAPKTNLNNTVTTGLIGNALEILPSSGSRLVFEETETDGRANVNVRRGTIRFWVKPDWSSGALGGTGPASWARLIELGSYSSPSVYGSFLFHLDPTGDSLHFTTQDSAGWSSGNFNFPIIWPANQWRQVTLTYSPSGSRLYIDGNLLTTGTGIGPVAPGSMRANGFAIGTNRSGTDRTKASFDELETFNYELPESQIAAEYLIPAWIDEHYPSGGYDHTADDDGDGLSNMKEMSYGTDPHDPDDGPETALLGHWKLDETSGTSAADSSIYNRTGTLEPNSQWTTQPGGTSAFETLSASGKINIPAANLRLGHSNADFSVAYWVKVNAAAGPTSHQTLAFKGNASHQRTFGMWLSPNSTKIHYRISGTTNSNMGGDSIASLPIGEWTHVAYVKEGSNLKLYLNGELDSQAALTAPTVGNNGPIQIGSAYGSTGALAAFQDFRIYDFAIGAPVLSTFRVPPDWIAEHFPEGEFDPDADPDNDGLTNREEFQYGTNPNTADSDGDGINDGVEVLTNGTDPSDFFNGSNPVLSIVSGNNQQALPSVTLPQQLSVRISNELDVPRVGVAVTFAIESGGGQLSLVNNGLTDSNGIARAWLQLPSTPGTNIVVKSTYQGQEATFSATVETPPTPVAAPGRPEITQEHGESEALVEWEDRSDNETGFSVERKRYGESWTRIATLPANTTSYLDTSVIPDEIYGYRIVAHSTVLQ